MADETVSIAIDLEGNAPEVAESAASAFDALRDSIDSDTKALADLNRQMKALQGGASVNIDTFRKLQGQTDATKNRISANTQVLVTHGQSLTRQKRALADSGAAFRNFVQGAKEVPGPLGQIGGKLGMISKLTVGGALAGGTLALTAAFVALAAAALTATVALAGYAIGIANARRNEDLRLQGLSKWRNWWLEMATGQRRAADSSSFLQQQLDAVSSSSALGRDRISEMQAELYRAGLRSGNLQAALEGLAITESTQGQEAAAAFKARAIGAALYGTSVKKLSDDVKARLGGIAKAQMLSLDVQARKSRESIALLFKDVKIDRLLEGVNAITQMLSQSSASGRALKAIIDGLLQPLLDWVSSKGIYVKRFFQGLIIGALSFGIVVLRVRNYLRDTFGDSEILRGMNAQDLAVRAGVIAFSLLAGAVLAGVAVVGIFVGAVVAAGATIYAVVSTMAAPFFMLWDVMKLTAQKFKEMSWTDLGKAVAFGIAEGIIGGSIAVVGAMTKLAERGINAFKAKLGIASPSRVARLEARQFGVGVALGTRDMIPSARRSSEDLAAASEAGLRRFSAAPAIPDGPSNAPMRAASGGSINVTIAPGAIVIQGGGKNDEKIAEEVLMQIEDRIVKAAHELGLGGV